MVPNFYESQWKGAVMWSIAAPSELHNNSEDSIQIVYLVQFLSGSW